MRKRVLLAAAMVGSVTVAVTIASAKQPHVRAVPFVVCNGVQRWDVKTLSDDAAPNVKLAPTDIEQISVKSLRAKNKRAGDGPERIAPEEDTVYELQAQLIEARWVWDKHASTPTKDRGDRDIHLVIAEPGRPKLTMIVEFPDPSCVQKAGPALTKMIRDARKA